MVMNIGESASNILAVHGLVKHFGQVKAVDGLTFSIRAGEIYGLLGPNGAGKTTTIKCILGLLTLQGGGVTVMGEDPLEVPDRVKTNIGYVAEEPLLYGSVTPREMLNFVASIRGLDEEEATELAKRLVTSLDVTKYYDSLMETLSRGNKQKIQLISALLHRPRLLILDEPLSGLDAKSSRVVKELLALHIERGGSVLLSTHIMEQAQNLCNRVGVINRGRMVAEGTLDELRALERSAGASLEEIFLKLTEQDQSVRETVEAFKNADSHQKG
jgi:ABC-2 type transport system ATP-binding protein